MRGLRPPHGRRAAASPSAPAVRGTRRTPAAAPAAAGRESGRRLRLPAGPHGPGGDLPAVPYAARGRCAVLRGVPVELPHQHRDVVHPGRPESAAGLPVPAAAAAASGRVRLPELAALAGEPPRRAADERPVPAAGSSAADSVPAAAGPSAATVVRPAAARRRLPSSPSNLSSRARTTGCCPRRPRHSRRRGLPGHSPRVPDRRVPDRRGRSPRPRSARSGSARFRSARSRSARSSTPTAGPAAAAGSTAAAAAELVRHRRSGP